MEDKSGLVLKLQPGSKTGYLGVIEVKGKFQGRLQVKGDGRGGLQKRRQVAIPGLFDTAKEAAEMLAILEKAGPENLWPGGIPPKQDKQHKPRCQRSRPLAELGPMVDVPMPVATVYAMPVAHPMPNTPTVVARPIFS